MLVSEFLTQTATALYGTDSPAPAFGSEVATEWINILNRKKNELYEDITKTWSASWRSSAPIEVGTVATVGTTTLTGTGTFFTDYNVGDTILVSGETVRTIATITSDTVLTVTVAFSTTASSLTFTRNIIIDDSFTDYSMHRSFLGFSDEVYVVKTDGIKEYFDLTKPQEDDHINQSVHLSGMNPQVLSFSQTISSTANIVGGTLQRAGYYMPGDVSLATDMLPLPDPYWGVMAVAGEAAGNDIQYEDKEANLNAKANNLFRLMARKNKRGTHGKPRKTPYPINPLNNSRLR